MLLYNISVVVLVCRLYRKTVGLVAHWQMPRQEPSPSQLSHLVLVVCFLTF